MSRPSGAETPMGWKPALRETGANPLGIVVFVRFWFILKATSNGGFA
jgi:hypothetical protein